MYDFLPFRTIILFFLVASLVGCTSQMPEPAPAEGPSTSKSSQTGLPLTTSEGLVRKVMVRADDTKLYSRADKNAGSCATAHQWDIFYIFEEQGGFFKVSGTIDGSGDGPCYARKQDVFEWNTELTLYIATSPHRENRPPIKYYKTPGALRNNTGEIAFIEKEQHYPEMFDRNNVQPILKEVASETYKVAAIYSQTNEQGESIFNGDYDFAYVTNTPRAHQIRRYVSRNELNEQLIELTEIYATDLSNMKQSTLGDVGKILIDLLSEDPFNAEGVFETWEEMMDDSDEIPEEAGEGIMDPDNWRGDTEIDRKILETIDRMKVLYGDDSNWGINDHAFVPLEWIEWRSN